jgi:hypothetical protein
MRIIRRITGTVSIVPDAIGQLEIQRGNAVEFDENFNPEEEPTTEEQVTEQGIEDWKNIDADSLDLLTNDPVSNPTADRWVPFMQRCQTDVQKLNSKDRAEQTTEQSSSTETH